MKISTKDKIVVAISISAFLLSITSTILGERRASANKELSLKEDLSRTLSRVMDLTKENAILYKDYSQDPDNHTFFKIQSGNFAQEKTFLIQKAVFIADQIPHLVSPVEFNTIALATTEAMDLTNAEKYYQLATKTATGPYYVVSAIRSYANFLFVQRRFEEGRNQFQTAVDQFPGDDDYFRSLNGFTFQMWGYNEMAIAEDRIRGTELFKEAEAQFASMDSMLWKNNMMRDLDSDVRRASSESLRLATLLDLNESPNSGAVPQDNKPLIPHTPP